MRNRRLRQPYPLFDIAPAQTRSARGLISHSLRFVPPFFEHEENASSGGICYGLERFVECSIVRWHDEVEIVVKSIIVNLR